MGYELLICTRKGLVIGRSEDRMSWSLSEPSFLGEQVGPLLSGPVRLNPLSRDGNGAG